MRLILISFFGLICVDSILEEDFLQYIHEEYGKEMAERLNRADLGPNGDGSFGGKQVPRSKRPVLLVHGLRNRAGYLWRNRDALSNSGWEAHHILATSYGGGDQGFFRGLFDAMKCDYVKQIRNMIEVTSSYYNSSLDIIAFSMGSPITRKAILGGKCVDTHEDLGGPLTDKIVVFVSVAGANQGSALCNFAFPGICGLETGLNCMSAF